VLRSLATLVSLRETTAFLGLEKEGINKLQRILQKQDTKDKTAKIGDHECG
jgi:hypothetical protein